MRESRYDVVVAGGGPAGIAASIAAARSGASTLLVERATRLGGMGSRALVHSICGLFLLREGPDAPLLWANSGFPIEFTTRLQTLEGASQPQRMGRVDVVLHSPSAFASLAATMTVETNNLEVWQEAKIVSASSGENTVSLSVARGGNVREITAGACIDATGDAEVLAQVSAEWQIEDQGHLQRPAYVFLLAGIVPGSIETEGRLQLAHLIATAVKNGTLDEDCLGAHFHAGAGPDEAFLTIDLAGGNHYDPLDDSCRAALFEEGASLADRLREFLATSGKGFADCHIAERPETLGVRESRRAIGEEMMTGTDLRTGRTRADGVARASWPIELRETARGPRWRFPEGLTPADIPLGALAPRGHPRLFVAGRCLSCDHEAQAAIRVMGTCFATGQAAGLAAAIAASGHIPQAAEINRKRIETMGFIQPAA